MKKLDLLRDSEGKLFFQYLIPAICSTLITSIYILVDTLIIGQGVGPLGISALNIILPVFQILNGIGLLFGIGGGILISTENGMGNKEKSNKYFATSLIVVILAAILIWIVLNINLEKICILLGANKSNLELVLEYANCIALFAPTFILSNYFSPIIRNFKKPKLVMSAVLAGSLLNILLDYIFVFPMQMGMFGAALATAIGSITTVLMLLTSFIKKSNRINLSKSMISLHSLKAIIKCGISSFLIESASGLAIFIFNIQILKYIGNDGIVIYGIISNCIIVGMALFNGVSQAIQPIIATNYGANMFVRVKKILNYAFATTVVIGIVLFSFVCLYTEEIINIFVSIDTTLINIAIPAIRIYLSAFCLMNINILITSYFQSIGRENYSSYISIVRGFLLNIVLALLLPIFLPSSILWLVVPIGEAITLICILTLNNKKSLSSYKYVEQAI